MARLSPRLFKRDPVFYIISHFAPWIHFAISRYEKNRRKGWEKSSEKNCEIFLTPARESHALLSGEICALLLRVFVRRD